MSGNKRSQIWQDVMRVNVNAALYAHPGAVPLLLKSDAGSRWSLRHQALAVGTRQQGAYARLEVCWKE